LIETLRTSPPSVEKFLTPKPRFGAFWSTHPGHIARGTACQHSLTRTPPAR
jgi:hypothetical protein